MTRCVPEVASTNASYTPPMLLLPLDRT
ncbi:hypothetical protein XFF6166_50041 [Xanthomonas citri pv. fuscans]|nr:hypothetical protein XFF6166_50041 [Xanthomonas citri pv. fuscans]SOO03995.1 hypothetical protein XFF7767_210009 [Xanthomonas citri pv. fuscans]SOO09151.1 hypothetical protein XFF6970_320008 [Xanthomonas citri pv. fuscans]SOO13326.1 hypothetical protein XFF7766_150039 [Xanthomonas citri pv. fuscans]SOO44764.1 hypothetical protein XFF1815_620042 [Xanthomonas citri pv. fuscans]